MTHTDARAAVDLALDQSVTLLATSGGAAVLPGPQVDAWSLPAEAKASLARYGLPGPRDDDLSRFLASFQSGRRPEVADGTEYYGLARFGVSRVCALPSGSVTAVPSSRDVHPQLEPLYPSGLLPSLVSTSVPQFVELAWRWGALVPILAEEQARVSVADDRAWREGRGADLPDPFDAYEDLCRYVLERLRRIDPQVDPASGFWADLLLDVW
ncbi:SUKH-4 family immunity protein [Cellulomonas fengjieae]|uniref:SUKH-4 family immunity protein n=1 Tax=Cellulomonas fengjieae TaxID=2819978 RepID=UPI001AAF0F86|nr:SUKH-4 family immunity protein [Cellulomonas fengjieae]MBO3102136.1 SUKH-4 family immunity protein [Cellulomonas fengjieae]